MHALRRMWQVVAGLGLAAFLIALAPAPASAWPLPGTKRPFKLFAQASIVMAVNRVQMGIISDGRVGTDPTGGGTQEGAFWPRGTNDSYVFNSGLQVAGVVAGAKSPANPWGGDTAGGWFFDGSGGRDQTEAVTQIFQSANPADIANWPADAFVPIGDEVAPIYSPALQGLPAASQGDVHFIAWEGNPALNVARLHPLGILVDYRLLSWNYPAGAQDITFLVATVYNVTSANAADYATHRPGIQPILLAQGQKFQALNNAKFGITLPVGGYTINPMLVAMAADNDVGDAVANYNGLILPFAMGYTYDGPFQNNAAGWKFDPSIFAPPFFVGTGFVGYKYLKGPDGPGAIQLFSTFCNNSGAGGPNCGSGHADPGSTIINYRLLAGTPAATDGQCNVTAPGKTPAQLHVCYMQLGAGGTDTRMQESSAPLVLAPGEAKSIVVAYVFAPPVAIPGFTPSATNVDPGNVTWSNSGDSMSIHNGLNRIDSLSGFVKYNGPTFNPDGSDHTPLQSEFSVVTGSLLGKALVAQALFDVQFLQEFAPDPPQFFLIPGDKQVTILWKPSATETTGDPFFQVVGSPTKLDASGATVANPLYDPNYRKFDVEGYRIYRGRSDNPSALKLLAQFDYAGTKFSDFTGVVVQGNCAPELGIATDCQAAYPTSVTPTPAGLSPAVPPGTAYTIHADFNIGPQADGSPLIFADLGASTPRVALVGGLTSLTVAADTTVAGAQEASFPKLADTGVPFIFVDVAGAPGCVGCGVNNGVNYFYSVTAFDVNAPGHGPTSLESAKLTKQVTPGAPAANFVNTVNSSQLGIFGRGGVVLTDSIMPTLDTTTGEFSKQFPRSGALKVALAGFPTQLLSGAGAAGLQYDSTTVTSFSSGGATNIVDWFTAAGAAVSVPLSIPATTGTATASGSFVALAVDSALSAKFGGGKGFTVGGTFSFTRQGGYVSGVWGRGCLNGAIPAPTGKSGFCYLNGPRWFSGANETQADPNAPNPAFPASGVVTTNFNNAGTLPGVTTLWHPDAYDYFTSGGGWRDIDQVLAVFATAADYKLYWGTAGKIDSVIDITDNEPVPFKTTLGSSWGVLNTSAAPPAGSYDGLAALTASDFACVPPFRTLGSSIACPTANYALANTVVPGQVAFSMGAAASQKTATVHANNGFGLYIKGRIFEIELTGGAVPAAGTVWTERDYIGTIFGGHGSTPGAGTADGGYAFVPALPLPFTAPGTAVQLQFNVTNQLQTATAAAVAKVHTVPDPYYITSAFETSIDAKDIQFVNVPIGATIRIYSASGVLLRVLQNNSTVLSGIVHWDVRNRTNQFVASGVYFYNVEVAGVSYTGRMTIVNYASTVQ